MNSASTQANDLLKAQIEGFTNFTGDLVHGGSAKSVMASINAKSRDLYQVKPSDIMVLEGFNPRTKNKDYYDGVYQLSLDIEKHGFMQDKPLAGYIAKREGKDTLILQDGHRRYAAVLMAVERGAKINTVPMVLKERGQSMIDLTLSLMHSNEGQAFTVYEKAVIAKRLQSYGWTNTQIAEEMHCSAAMVGQLMTLAGSPVAIQELVQTGQLSATEAIGLVKSHGEHASSVAKGMVAKAKGEGKKKTTAKDRTDGKVRRAKALGYALYTELTHLFLEKKVTDVMSAEVYTAIDALMTKIEKEKSAKVAKVAKAPKPVKLKVVKPAAKKTTAKKMVLARVDVSKMNGQHAQARGSRGPR